MRRFGLYDVPGESGDYIRPPAGPRSIFRQEVKRPIWRNDLRIARRTAWPV